MTTPKTDSWQPALPAPLPAGVDPAKLFAGIDWHQRWEVFQGVFTPGRNPVCSLLDRVGLPTDLRDKRVLDIGAWHGCFSFECKRRGAEEVVALSLEDPEAVGFYRLKNVLGVNGMRYQRQSIYTADKNLLGEFDVVLFLGVLYHLRYPLLAIDKIRTLCRGQVHVETYVIDDDFVLPGFGEGKLERLKDVHSRLPHVPLWLFYKDNELISDRSNWFGPNVRAVLAAFESAGFAIRLTEQWGTRAGFIATIGSSLETALARTYELAAENRQFLGL